MSVTVTKVDGRPASMYLGAGEVVIGSDEDFTHTISLNTASFLSALEQLGYLVIPIKGDVR